MDLLTGKIIEQVYGKSIQHYKDYLKVEAQKVVTLLQNKQKVENEVYDAEIKSREEMREKGLKTYHLSYLPHTTTWIDIVSYEGLLNNIDNWNILDININNYGMLDPKVAKIHNAFIDKMTDEIANKLMRGESII